MKKCKYCAEEILEDAVVCKHCGKSQKKSLSRMNKVLLVLVGILTFLCVLVFVIPNPNATSQSSAPRVVTPTPNIIPSCYVGVEIDGDIADFSVEVVGTGAFERCSIALDKSQDNIEFFTIQNSDFREYYADGYIQCSTTVQGDRIVVRSDTRSGNVLTDGFCEGLPIDTGTSG